MRPTAAGVTAIVMLSGITGRAQVQQSFMTACATIACDIQKDWLRNNIMLYGLAGAMPEDKYGFKPTPAQQTFAERLMHVVEIDQSLLKTIGPRTPPPPINMKATSKADVMAAIQRSGEYGAAVLKEFTDQQLAERVDSPWFMGPTSSRQRIVYFLMTHSQDTYGQLAVYLRLNGVTPPLSRQP